MRDVAYPCTDPPRDRGSPAKPRFADSDSKSEVPVIALTEIGVEADAAEAAEHGASAYLYEDSTTAEEFTRAIDAAIDEATTGQPVRQQTARRRYGSWTTRGWRSSWPPRNRSATVRRAHGSLPKTIMHSRLVAPVIVLVSALVALLAATPQGGPQDRPQDKQNKKPKVGYDDTPQIPGQKWKVHDGNRPQPRIVTPGTANTGGAPGKAPSDAIVLFDGENLDKWTGRGGKANWIVKDGHFEANRTGDVSTKDVFGDCQIHIEWRAPTPVKGKSQGRGNSGVYLMGTYEVQVLDSYENATYPDGQAGALYGQTPPLVNASRKPGAWQAYDIIFIAPRFKDRQLVSPGYVTVIHNGVLIHHHRALIGATAHRKVAKYRPHGPKGPIKLQDHGSPVRYRNVWVRELKGYDAR